MSLKFSSPLPPLEGVTRWVGAAPMDADLAGHPVFVQFWAVSCGYCLMNAPLIAGWKEYYGPLGLRLVTVHASPPLTDAQREGVGATIERARHPDAVRAR